MVISLQKLVEYVIHLGPTKNQEKKPNYVGAICSCDSIIDEYKYLSLSKKEKYKYILVI